MQSKKGLSPLSPPVHSSDADRASIVEGKSSSSDRRTLKILPPTSNETVVASSSSDDGMAAVWWLTTLRTMSGGAAFLCAYVQAGARKTVCDTRLVLGEEEEDRKKQRAVIPVDHLERLL